MDSRCVSNEKPLLESGTLGTKGHVQVIVPHLTESYGSQRDPAEKSVPLWYQVFQMRAYTSSTIHSFPNNIDHCIQWARDRFEKVFTTAIKDTLNAIEDPSYISVGSINK